MMVTPCRKRGLDINYHEYYIITIASTQQNFYFVAFEIGNVCRTSIDSLDAIFLNRHPLASTPIRKCTLLFFKLTIK